MSLLEKARRLPRGYWFYYIPLAAAALGFALFLKDAALPWEKGVAAREAAGKAVKPMHHGITGLWYGAWGAIAVLAVLAAIGPLALRKRSAGFVRKDAELGRRSRATFAIFAAITVSIAAFEMAPRLNSSLWGDEDYSVRRSIVGQFERDAEGELWYRELSWWDTLFAYRTPNNHVLFSILARLSHGGRIQSDDPSQLHFDETRIRLPAFLFGLAAIPAIGYLLAVIGYRRAAIAAMFLLALHPFYLRHAPEARGYPLTLFFAPLVLTFLIKALRRDRAIYWVGFALSQALLFYCYPGTIYFLVAVNLAAAWQLCRRRPVADRVATAARWLAANLLAALPIVFLMMPLLPQMRNYMSRNRAQGDLKLSWIEDNLSHMAAGVPWFQPDASNPLQYSLEGSPLISSILLAIFYIAVLAGLWRLLRSGHGWIAAALVAPYLLMLTHAWISRALLYQWYAVPLLPLFVALAALGVEYPASRITDIRHRTLAGFLTLAAVLALYVPATRAQVRTLRHHAVEPLRESVALTREFINPTHPKINDVFTVHFCQGTRGYDPTAHFFKPEAKEPDAAEKLRALMMRADAEGKPLFANFAMPALARLEWPGIMQVIDDPRYFEPVEDSPIWGLQEPCTRYIYRYRRNSYQSDTRTDGDGS